LVGLQPDIILTYTTPATVAVQRETRTIPIVLSIVDPRLLFWGVFANRASSGFVFARDGATQAPKR
jgi:hypothetical protein